MPHCRCWIVTALSLVTFAIAGTGCNSAGQVAERTALAESGLLQEKNGRFGRIYRYFPDQQVYHSAWQDKYFWRDSNGHWRATVMLPRDISIDEGAAVYVTLYTSEPQDYHGVVLAQHPPTGSEDFSNYGHAIAAAADDRP